MEVITDDSMEFDFASSPSENKNTKRKTETDMRIFSAYLISLNEVRPIEALPPIELDRYLTTFFSVIKKHDGNEYEPASLRGMLCSVERYLRSKNYPNSVTRDAVFLDTRNMLKEKQKILREISKTQKKTKQELLTASTVERLKQLYNAKEFGPYSPAAIINSLCFAFVIHLKIRKAVDHKQLLWGDIILKRNGTTEYLCYEPLQGFDYLRPKLSGISQFRIYSQHTQDSSVDPIYIYKLYASKRPHTMMAPDSPFYLGIAVVCNSIPQQQQWFKPSPMGVNKLSDLVRMIRDITGSLSMIPGDHFHLDNGHILSEMGDANFDDVTHDVTMDDAGDRDDTIEDDEVFEVNKRIKLENTCPTDEQDPRYESNTERKPFPKESECSSSIDMSATNALSPPFTEHGSLDRSSDFSKNDSSKVGQVKKTISESLDSLDATSRSEILRWISTIKDNTDNTSEAENDSQNFLVNLTFTKSQLRSHSPFTVTADVKPFSHVCNTKGVEHDDQESTKSHELECSSVIETNTANGFKISGINKRGERKKTEENIVYQKRVQSQSLAINAKYLKDRCSQRVSVDNEDGQPETSKTDDSIGTKHSLPVYPFELPKEYASIYSTWPAVDPRFALFMRHNLITGYRNLVNLENCTNVKKNTE